MSSDDPLGADRVDGVAEPDEQRLEVVVAGLLDVLPLDLDVVDDELAVGAELLEVPAERGDVRRRAPRRSPRRRGGRRARPCSMPRDEELGGEQRLAAAGAAGDERGAAAGQAAVT